MSAELWVTFFRHVRNHGSKFLTKMARPRLKLGSDTPNPPPPPGGVSFIPKGKTRLRIGKGVHPTKAVFCPLNCFEESRRRREAVLF